MDQENIIKENNEISIIDLLAVVIRFRKLIIFGTLIPTIIAAVYLFVVKPRITPVVVQPEPYEEVKALYTIRLYYPQAKLYEGIAVNFNRHWDFNARILFDFINPTIIGPLYEENQFADTCKKGEGENYVTPLIKVGQITCANSYDTTYLITFNMPINSEEKLNDFVNSFIEYEHNLIQEKYLEDHIELLQVRMQRKLKEVENADPKTVNFDEIQRAKDILQDIETYKRENKPFYEIEGKPVIERTVITPEPISVKRDSPKKIIIVSLGSFFIFIFISFFINAIKSIKADPEASRKIKDAWISGK